ncbi:MULTISPECIES: PilN domain-containing protein [Calditerrivibrio]|uniref:PilN domain-containing protein n=1 Tax=Calditerrivibrio TaxID=545865 RepID=UPI003C733ED1
MTKRFINILPEQYRFDLRKYAAFKVFKSVLLANIIILIAVFSVDKYTQIKMKNMIIEKENKIREIQKLNQSVLAYETEKKKLEDVISKLSATEKIYTSLFNTNVSYFIDMSRTLDLIKEGIYINKLSYSDGVVNMSAVATNPKSFYHFYKNLENTTYIADKRFYNLTEEGGVYNFSVVIRYRGLNE